MEISNKTKNVLKKICISGLKLFIIITSIWFILNFVLGIFRLSGNNMYPALKDGDLCITYKLDDYCKNDIVVYKVNNEIKFGRIIATAGDTVDGDEEGLLLNGSRVNENVFYNTSMLNNNLDLPITLNENEFFILNDYREDINDSRTYNMLTKDSFNGKLFLVFRRRGF